MKGNLILLYLLMGISIAGICQQKLPFQNFPDSADSKDFFRHLFGTNGSVNLPYQVVKLQIKDYPHFLITSKKEVQNYIKAKYGLTDSLADIRELFFLQNGDKIPVIDTIYFSKIPEIGRRDIHHDSVLRKYRTLSLVDFLNKYCPIPQFQQNIFVLAYMFEKRMLYDWNEQHINFLTTSLLIDKYNIQWDGKNKIWKQSLDNKFIHNKERMINTSQ